MADPYYGEIRAFAFNYPPVDWAFCDGTGVNAVQAQVLFSVIGNLYGGNTTVFNLPKLQGRTVMGSGMGPNLTPRSVADAVGTYSETLTVAQVPDHTHSVVAEGANASALAPAGAYLAKGVKGTPPRVTAVNTYAGSAPNALMVSALAPVGSSGPHSNLQPYLTLNFCICVNGADYPLRP